MTALTRMSKAQLLEEAAERGLEVPKKITQAELLAFITAFDDELQAETEVVDAVEVEVEEDDELQVGAEVAIREIETQEVAIHEEREHAYQPTHVLPSPQEWEATMVMARTIAATTFVPKAYRGNPEAVVAGILYGREIGLGPMQALQKVHIIDGKPSLSAEEMMAQMRRGGVIILKSESTRERAWIKAKRRDTGEEAEVEWTIQDAVDAGLTSKDNWSKYATDMLWARCVGRLCRRLGSDLVGGMVYAAEEMADWDDGGYGGSGYSTEPRAAEAFDPKKKLLTGAPKDWKPVMALLKDMDAAIPWSEIIKEATVSVYGEAAADLKSQSAEIKKEALARTSNAAFRISQYFENETFLSEESIKRAFAEMFEGVSVTIPSHEADDDVAEADHDAPVAHEGAAAETATSEEPDAGEEHEDEPTPLGPAPLPTDSGIEF